MGEIGSGHPARRHAPAGRGRLPSTRRGAVLPLVAVSLVGVMSVSALAIDVGSLQRQRRIAQTAADAGATAGAHEIFRAQPQDSVFASARAETTRNGFTDATDGVTVSVYNGPASGFYINNLEYVEVLVTRPATTIFSTLLGRTSVTIHVRAVAGMPAPSLSCIYTLDPNDEKSLYVSGNPSRLEASCGIVVNSNRNNAATIESGAVLVATSLAVTGGINQSGGTVVVPAGSTATGLPLATDPLAYLSVPPFCSASPNPSCVEATTCDYTNMKVDNASLTLSPGIYCGGINITGTGTATLNPGLYILRGGGLEMGGGVITGTGVTLVNTNGIDPNGRDKFMKIKLGSASYANLSAPTTGALAGILFYQDPAGGLSGAVYENEISSGSNSVFNGTLYFPTQPLEIASGSRTTVTGGIVATNLEVTSNSQLYVSSPTGGLPGESLFKRVS
ncbi:MAG TPA: pilus assembly protein TadG-related protein, partial [Gemmatimonadaceae bacterium]|nr:pilus assembly protein TadG-related protein [Gemmatimonadaceae bacterium]